MRKRGHKTDLSEPSVLKPHSSVLCERLLNAGMVTLLMLTPLAFGAVHVWAFSLMEMGIFFLIMLWAGYVLWAGSEQQAAQRRMSRRAVLPVLPCVLFLSLALFQLLPLPPALLQVLSPSTYKIYETALPGWPHHEPFADLTQSSALRPDSVLSPQSSALSSPQSSVLSPHSSVLSSPQSSSWRPLSVYPPASHEEILKLLAYGAFFVLIARTGHPRLLLFSLIVSGTGLALLAFLQQATWNGKLLWFFVPHDWSGPQAGQEGRLHGPFANADHLAGYLEMVLPLAIVAALIFGRRLRRQLITYEETVPLPWQERLRRSIRRIALTLDVLFSPPALLCGLLILSAILILTALVFTLSRGGFSATFASLFFLAWLLWPRPAPPSLSPQSSALSPDRSSALSPHYLAWGSLGRAACLLGLLAVPVLYLEYPQLFGRFLQIPQEMETDRLPAYAATLTLWRDYPWFGVGLGNFQEVFPLYQPAAAGQVFYNYTHNDYLQLLAETGIVGFGSLTGALGTVLWKAGRSWRQARGEHRLWLAGILAGIVAMLLHSLVDFNLHIPSNTLLFVALSALLVRLGGAMGQRTRTRKREARQEASLRTPAMTFLS